jgi:hypothetical protein
VSGYTFTFGEGLLEAASQALSDGGPVLYVAFDIEARGPVIRRDHLGIALGGVRLPDVDVPTACHRGVARDGTLVLTGSTTPFSDEMLRALYPTREVYRARYKQAAEAAVDAGVLLAHDAERMVAALD